MFKWFNDKGIFIQVELTCETLGAYPPADILWRHGDGALVTGKFNIFHDFQPLYIHLITRGNGWPSDNDGGKCIPHQIHSPLAAWRRGNRSVCSLQRGLPWREDLEPCQVEGASSSLSDSYLHLILNNLRRRNCRAGMHCNRLPHQPDLHVDHWWTKDGGWRWKHFEIGTPWSRGWWLNCDVPGTFRPYGQSNSTILHYLMPLFTLIHIFGSWWLW